MPALVAIAIRYIIMAAVQLGIWSLIEKYGLPLLNNAIQQTMITFGVDKKTAEDIVGNGIIHAFEEVGIFAATLKTKLPIKAAEILGFTSRGFIKKVLPKTVETAVVAAEKAGSLGSTITAAGVDAISGVTAASKGILSAKVKDVMSILGLVVGLPTAFLYMAAQYIDYATWSGSAYKGTFQKVLSVFGLQPDKVAADAKTISTEMWDKILAVYKNLGVTAINDPYKQQSVIFTRQNLVNLVDKVAAQIIAEKGKVTQSELIAGTQAFMVLGKTITDTDITKAFSTTLAAPAAAPATTTPTPSTSVFTGIISQGVLSQTPNFIARENDLIESESELKSAAENNLAMFLVALPNRIVYEIKLVSRVIMKDGTTRVGASQKIQIGTYADGTPKYKTFVNRFAVANVYAFTSRNVRTKLDTIVLGPVDITRYNPQATQLVDLSNVLPTTLTTTSISNIPIEQAAAPVESIALPAPTPTQPPTAGAAALPAPAPLFSAAKIRYTGGTSGGGVDMTQNFEYDGKSFSLTFPLNTWKGDMDREIENLLIQLGVVSDPNFTIFPLPGQASVIQPQPQPTTTQPTQTAVSTEIPASNNPNKCSAATIANFFDVNSKTYPTVTKRGELYEAFGLGQASLYTGTYEQNLKLLTEFKKRSRCPGY